MHLGSERKDMSDCMDAVDWWPKRHCVTTMLYRLMNVAMALKAKTRKFGAFHLEGRVNR